MNLLLVSGLPVFRGAIRRFSLRVDTRFQHRCELVWSGSHCRSWVDQIGRSLTLSRKGFDSSSGGKPSPILPNGKLVPLPIPEGNNPDPHSYDEISVNQIPLGALVEELTGGKTKRTNHCHLDPDLDAGSLPRVDGWRPAFGQIDSAQGYLRNQCVGVGDLFLFFGWFRKVEQAGGVWRYIGRAPELHVLYGWMKVGNVIPVPVANAARTTVTLAPFADHPHLLGRNNVSNTLYLAADSLDCPGISHRSGAGLFGKVSASRTLTDTNPLSNAKRLRSTWRLPQWFHPNSGTTLGRHENRDNWRTDGTDSILLGAAAFPGQEFVLTPHPRAEVDSWLQSIFREED